MAKKPELKVRRAFVVALPSKHLIVKQMADGGVEYEPALTAYAAGMQARSLDPDAFSVNGGDFLLAGAITSFEDRDAALKQPKK